MQETDDKIIDVVEAFSCPHQTEGYMKQYRDWRYNQNNRFAFRFTKNPKESAFSENQAVVNGTPEHAEQSALQRFGILYGSLLLTVLVIENVLDKLLVGLLGARGFHIELMFWGESRLYGDEQVVFIVTVLIGLLKYIIPAIVALLLLRLPLRVSFPVRIAQPLHLLMGMMLVMMMSMAMGMFLVSRSSEMDKYRMIDYAITSADHRLILYIMFTVFITPLAFELLIHGCLFQVMRQFGDIFTILSTTLLAALMTHNIQDAVRIGLLTLTISYFMIETGSFLTAVILHVVHEIYMFVLFSIETFGSIYSWQWWVLILMPCALGLIAMLYFGIRRLKKPSAPQFVTSYLSMWDKCSVFFVSLPMMAFAVSCVVLMIVTAFFL